MWSFEGIGFPGRVISSVDTEPPVIRWIVVAMLGHSNVVFFTPRVPVENFIEQSKIVLKTTSFPDCVSSQPNILLVILPINPLVGEIVVGGVLDCH